MFDDDKVPSNLPTGGKSMLDNFGAGEGGAPKTPPSTRPIAPSKPAAPAPTAPALQSAASSPVPRLAPRSQQGGAGSPGGVGPAAPPSPEAVDDMFSGMKEAAPTAPPPRFTPPAPLAAKITEETTVETPRQGFKKIIIAAFGVLVLAGTIAVGGYFAYNRFLKTKPLSPNLNVSLPPPSPQPSPESAPPPPSPARIDSDNDGLFDEEETANKTNPLSPDSDGDGLFDAEEISVYKTDPLNPDTDGDTFRDGDEVRNGYDPKGPGKLIRIPAGQ